jgi:hypothetical protein
MWRIERWKVWAVLTSAAWAAASSWAQPAAGLSVQLAPSPRVECLTLPEGAKLVYPPEAYERRDGGTVRIEMVFERSDAAPRVRVLDRDTFASLRDAVTEHVRRYRMPCLAAEHGPSTIRQDYVFVPNDGRKVVATAPVEDAALQARRQECLKLPAQAASYSKAAVKDEEQGVVMLELRFDRIEQEPQVNVLAAPPGRWLRREVVEWAKDVRVRCADRLPERIVFTHIFKFEGSERDVLNDMDLRTFLTHSSKYDPGVYFDLTRMGCPFDVRVTYYRPHHRNSIGQLDRDVPERRPFLDWLANVELRLDRVAANRVLGSDFTLHVPCTKVDL